MELTNNRTRKLKKQQHQKQNKEKNAIDQLHLMQESKYEYFRPMRIPMRHTIKGIQHPDLTLTKNNK